METKFQTSFIPKKPTSSTIGGIPSRAPKTHTTSIFMMLATLIFILSLLAVGGVFAYKQYLFKQQDSLKVELATREKQFDPNLIETLKAEDVTISLARQVLNNHIALSQVFDILGRFTIANVRFLSLEATVPSTVNTTGSADNNIKISMQGYGSSLTAIAFQSDVLGQLEKYNLRKIVKNPILNNPTVGANGVVSFGLTAELDPATFSYEKMISPSEATSSTSN